MSTKAERYDWSKLDEVGVPSHQLLSELRIDYTYQRPLNEGKVLRFARSFSWSAFGTIKVAVRKDGTKWIFDGQHRAEAARHRGDILEVPVMLYKSSGVEWEAEQYIISNTNTKAPTSFEKYKAFLSYREEHAMKVEAILRACDYVVVKGPSPGRNIRCISTMMAFAARDMDAMRRAFPVVAKLCNYTQPVLESLLGGIWYIERYNPNTLSVVDGKWDKRLMRLGYEGAVKACLKGREWHLTATPHSWGDGLMRALNKDVRNEDLKLRTSAGSGKEK